MGKLQIRIWVQWQGINKPATVFTKQCDEKDARKLALEFFEANPCCQSLSPEVTWTQTVYVSL